MTIALTCPACARALKVKDELAGRKVKCPKCGAVIAVAAARAESETRVTAQAPKPAREPVDEEPDEDERPRKKKKKKKSGNGLLIGAVVGGVALIGIVVFLMLPSGAVREKAPATKKEPPQQAADEKPKQKAEENAVQVEKKAPVGAIGRARELTEVQNVLRQLGVAYRNFEASENRGPKNQAELSSYYENNGQINEYLTKKWVTFIWGVPRRSFDENGASNTVLAYETDADRQGIRMVLFGDGSVNGLDEAQFSQAPKAKGK